jgi:hypothetical protein
MESIQVAYGLRIDGLQFKEIDFIDTTPEFKNILLRPIEGQNCRYELLIRKNALSTTESQLRAIFNEASLEADNFKYIFSVADDVKIFDFECTGYYHNTHLVSYHSIFRNGPGLSMSADATVTAGEPSVRKVKEKMKLKYDLPSIQMFYDVATIRAGLEKLDKDISDKAALK